GVAATAEPPRETGGEDRAHARHPRDGRGTAQLPTPAPGLRGRHTAPDHPALAPRGPVGQHAGGHVSEGDDMAVSGRIDELATEVERLREAFADLLEAAQDMRDYVPEQFAKKWHHDEALDCARVVRKEWE